MRKPFLGCIQQYVYETMMTLFMKSIILGVLFPVWSISFDGVLSYTFSRLSSLRTPMWIPERMVMMISDFQKLRMNLFILPHHHLPGSRLQVGERYPLVWPFVRSWVMKTIVLINEFMWKHVGTILINWNIKGGYTSILLMWPYETYSLSYISCATTLIDVDHIFHVHLVPISLQFNLRRAAKARIARMVAPKSKRKELNAPEYVKSEWENGDRDSMAELLTRLNFDKEWVQKPIKCDPSY